MIPAARSIAKNLELLFDKRGTRLEVCYHRIVKRHLARRVVDLSLERSLSLF